MTNTQVSSMLDKLGAVKDTMSSRQVFGEAYQVDGVTLIPVASVRGGGGGGGGEGNAPGNGAADAGTGSGIGLGFGVQVRPLGVFAVKEGQVSWQPVIDVMRVILGAQILAFFAILTIRRVLMRKLR